MLGGGAVDGLAVADRRREVGTRRASMRLITRLLRLDRLAVVALHHREHDGRGRPGDLALARVLVELVGEVADLQPERVDAVGGQVVRLRRDQQHVRGRDGVLGDQPEVRVRSR